MTLTVEASKLATPELNCHELLVKQSGAQFRICEIKAFVKGTEREIDGTISYVSSDTSVFTTNGSKGEEFHPEGSFSDLSVRRATLTVTFTPKDSSTYSVATLVFTVTVTRSSASGGASNWQVSITA